MVINPHIAACIQLFAKGYCIPSDTAVRTELLYAHFKRWFPTIRPTITHPTLGKLPLIGLPAKSTFGRQLVMEGVPWRLCNGYREFFIRYSLPSVG